MVTKSRLAVVARAGRTPAHRVTTGSVLKSQRQQTIGTPEMNKKFLAHGIAAILLVCAPPLSNAADTDAVVQTAGGIPYVSGGVGTESMDRLNRVVGDFNLKLVFAAKSGSYLSGVQVAISDVKGKEVLSKRSLGPWFLVKLPAGKYRIVATFAGNAEKREITVGAEKLTTIDFRWTSD
jgi:hypothetical protein